MAPPTGGGISAGDAVWTITGDNSPLGVALAQSEAAVQKSTAEIGAAFVKVGAGMTALGAGIMGALGGTVKVWADTGDEIAKLSVKTGMSTESLSKFGYSASLADSSVGEFGSSVLKMQRNLDEAALGTGTATDALARLGIGLDQIVGKSPDDQFMILAGAISQVGDANARTAITMDIFGRSGAALLPMIMSGTEAIKAQGEEAQRLGVVYDKDGAQAAERFNDSLTTMQTAFRGVVIQMGPMIAELTEDLIPAIVNAASNATKWVQENQGLVESLLKIAAVVGVVMSVVGPLFMTIGTVALVFGPAITAITTVVGAFALVGPALAAIGAAVAGAAAVIAAPITIAVLAIGIAVSAIIANWQGIKEGLDVIWDGIKFAASAVVSFLAGIWDGIVAVFRAGWDFVAGIIDQIASAVGGLFGGIGDLMMGNFGGIPGRAAGGPVEANRPYIVGEEGPELFLPRSSGTIVPNGGGATVNINLGGVSVRNDNDIRRLSEELARSMGRELRGLGAMA